MNTKSKPKVGMLLIGSKRFRALGVGTADGTYEERKLVEAETYINRFSEFADLVYSGIIYEREDITRTIDEFFTARVDCVFAAYLSWAEDFTWIRFLRDMPPVPIFFSSIVRDKLDITDTNDENQFVEFLSAGALVGVQEASGSFRRFNRDMCETYIGTLNDVAARLKIFAKAAQVRSQLRRTNLSLLACYNEAMWATYVDPYNIFSKIGPEIHFLSVQELTGEIETVPQSLTEELTKSIADRYRMMPNVDYEKFKASVRASYAMEQIAKRSNTDLLVLNDIDTVLFKYVGLRPGFTPTSSDAEMVTVPEGDIGGGLATYILKLLAGTNANFIEPFYIDHVRGIFTAGHAGPNDYREAPENVIIARDERFAKTQWKYAGAPFAWYVFPAGIKTMLHMSERDGKMKMVCTLVECLPTKHYLASYSHAEFRHATLTPEELFNKIIPIGVTQHYGIVSGDVTAELECLAKLCGFEYDCIK
jgi:L-arabinose isomerase